MEHRQSSANPQPTSTTCSIPVVPFNITYGYVSSVTEYSKVSSTGGNTQMTIWRFKSDGTLDK